MYPKELCEGRNEQELHHRVPWQSRSLERLSHLPKVTKHDKQTETDSLLKVKQDFPGGPVVKNLPANARDMGSIPGLEIFHMPWGN